jgi:hypothetical protein
MFVPAPDTVGTLRIRRPGEGGVQGDFDHIVPCVSPALNTQSGSHHAPDTKAYVVTQYGDVVGALTAKGPQAMGAPEVDGGHYLPMTQYGDVAGSLTARHDSSPCADRGQNVVAFSCKDHGADAGDVSPTLRAMGHGASHANAGGQVAVAFQTGNLRRGAGSNPSTEVFPTLKSDQGRGLSDQAPCVAIQERAICGNQGGDYVLQSVAHVDVMPTLRAAASQDGPGHGARSGDSKDEYIVPVYPIDTQNMTEGHASGGLGFGAQGDPSFTLTKGHSHAVAYDMRGREGGTQMEGPHDTANIRAASGGSSKSYVAASAVRRLTPRECERLQGFPDDYTLVDHRKKPAADGPRYKALGNSMAVPVMQWIGKRIQLVDDLLSVL